MVITSCSRVSVGQHFVFMRCSGSEIYVPRDPLGQYVIFKRSDGRHFMFKRSSVPAIMFKRFSGQHFVFMRCSGSTLRVYEIQWVSSLYSERSTGASLHVQEVNWSSLLVQEVQCVSTSCS